MYDRFLFFEENYREEAAAEIANWFLFFEENYREEAAAEIANCKASKTTPISHLERYVCMEFCFFGVWYVVHYGFEDNEGAKNLAQNPVCTSNSEHINVRHHVLRELIFEGEFVISHVESDDQHADVLTKMLDYYTAFCYHRDF